MDNDNDDHCDDGNGNEDTRAKWSNQLIATIRLLTWPFNHSNGLAFRCIYKHAIKVKQNFISLIELSQQKQAAAKFSMKWTSLFNYLKLSLWLLCEHTQYFLPEQTANH